MTRVGAAVAATVLATVFPAESSPAKTFPNRIQITAKEFFYSASTRTIKPGAAVIQFVNYGEDPHDLRVQRTGGRLYKAPKLDPGSIYDLNITLVPGKYQLWCSIADHRKLGMSATLIVK